ncbi:MULTISPECIES: ABC transporter substrate-binding protein [Pseudomonas]|uniref:Restriction endonuclease n=2 Tax=Pseudomonadaceae TaxID=135621 RepID=A0A0D0KQT2_9PSED|nr:MULTISPECIES: ABC transporter substrate-binding protein [Pseudomonas]KIQ00411.1 restriction endonuclease [Pseudomonas fulva]MCW2291266.1 polar amino acid transport system substrate-binding protein [Pseudomonas sp. BIGb0408]NYH74163.1 polar amino acid transport system substrate-binding protein [Pseudomonas flavescens]
MNELLHIVKGELAPEGVLRAAINFGNPVLAQPGHDGSPHGVSVSLAKELASELQVELELISFDAAGKVFAAMQDGVWSIAFLAIEPVRAEQIDFSEPYVIIEGTYLVKDDSPYTHCDHLDNDGIRIAVGQGAAYDLYLSRTLQKATLERASTSSGAVDLFISDALDAAAGVRQPLELFAASNTGYRVLEGGFTAIRQAMAVPKQHKQAAAYIQTFLSKRLESGFIRGALLATGQTDVSAPR